MEESSSCCFNWEEANQKKKKKKKSEWDKMQPGDTGPIMALKTFLLLFDCFQQRLIRHFEIKTWTILPKCPDRDCFWLFQSIKQDRLSFLATIWEGFTILLK